MNIIKIDTVKFEAQTKIKEVSKMSGPGVLQCYLEFKISLDNSWTEVEIFLSLAENSTENESLTQWKTT